jgi:hypothetical protein
LDESVSPELMRLKEEELEFQASIIYIVQLCLKVKGNIAKENQIRSNLCTNNITKIFLKIQGRKT